MDKNKPQPKNRPSIRELLRNYPPDDYNATLRWNYFRVVIFVLFATPFMIFFALVISYIRPGYQSLRYAGVYKYFSRVFIINSHLNLCGLMVLLLISTLIIISMMERIRIKRQIRSGTSTKWSSVSEDFEKLRGDGD